MKAYLVIMALILGSGLAFSVPAFSVPPFSDNGSEGLADHTKLGVEDLWLTCKLSDKCYEIPISSITYIEFGVGMHDLPIAYISLQNTVDSVLTCPKAMLLEGRQCDF